MVVIDGFHAMVAFTSANDSYQFLIFREIYDAYFFINPYSFMIVEVVDGNFEFYLQMIYGSFLLMSHLVLITMVQVPKKTSLGLKQQLHLQSQVKNFSFLSQITIHQLVFKQMTLIYSILDLFVTFDKITEQNWSFVFETLSFFFANLIYDDSICCRLRLILGCL